jgi:cobalt-precorrin-6B (C15)-methyltransferase
MSRCIMLGIPDDDFIRGNVPMTKEEIRVLSISKLRLNKDSIIWDIGAGTGSVSVEASFISTEGSIYAVEQNPEGIELIKANTDKFGCKNIKIIHGKAPVILKDLPDPDRIFVGGSGDATEEILDISLKRMKMDGVIVVNSITLDTAYISEKILKDRGLDVESICVNISVSKNAGNKTMMIARNPVFIITGRNSKVDNNFNKVEE